MSSNIYLIRILITIKILLSVKNLNFDNMIDTDVVTHS